MTVVVAIGYMLLSQFFRSTVVNVGTLVKSFLFLPCYAENDKIYPVYSIGWTLNLEMFFYFLFFVAMKMNHKQRGNIAVVMACLLILAGILFEPQNVMLKFWTKTRLVDFITGIGIYELEQKVGEVRINKKICTGVILAMLIGLFSREYLLGDWFTYLWNTCCGAVLLFFCLPFKGISVNRYLRGLGDISYAIYMTHFLIIGIVCRVFIDNTEVNFFNTCVVIIAALSVIGCAVITDQIFQVVLFKRHWKRSIKECLLKYYQRKR